MSTVKHPLEWTNYAHDRGWDVLLDAAAFVPTNRLDLAVVQPDFVCISFHKMFGYPTGVGALLVRRRNGQVRVRSGPGARSGQKRSRILDGTLPTCPFPR